MIIWTVLFDSFLIPDSVIENGSIGWLFSKNLQSIKLMDSLLISKVIVSSDQFTLDGDSLIRSVEAASQWTNNKWNAIETLQGSRRMGVCGAAERQHALQRAAASVGPADCRVGVRFVPGPSQHLSAGIIILLISCERNSQDLFGHFKWFLFGSLIYCHYLLLSMLRNAQFCPSWAM